jgi:hypothetical protein
MAPAFTKSATGTIKSPKGRLFYANLITAGALAKNEKDEKKFGWQATLLLPADVDLTFLRAEIEAVIADNVTAAKRSTTKLAPLPILNTKDQGRLASYADDYPHLIRLKSRAFDRSGKRRQAPQVVGPDAKPIDPADEPDLIYNGRWAALTFIPFWYGTESGAAAPGVSLGLANVQLLTMNGDPGEPMAGGQSRATDEFEAVAEDDLADLEGVA